MALSCKVLQRGTPVLHVVLACLMIAPAGAAPAFDLSAAYAPSSMLVAGYYACRSGLDSDRFTLELDVGAGGSYAARGQDGTGLMEMSAADGTIDFVGGVLMTDDTATTYARNTIRLSDGNAVLIIRYDFGSLVTDDYCALVE